MNTYENKEVILHVNDVCVKYGEKIAIQGVSLTEYNVVRPGILQGQNIAVVGRSGRGKSTLFRVLTGLYSPTTGEVLIPDGTGTKDAEGRFNAKIVKEGDVGFVDQKYTLFRHKSVYNACMFALRKTSMSKQEKHDKIMSMLNVWGLEKVKNQFPCELSGGQRQRTAIIEQLLSSGNYIVFDEPFSGLDVYNINEVKKAFKLISSTNELNTIIFSTHDIELAAELADTIYVLGYPTMPDGQKASYGTIIQKYDLKQLGLAWSEELTAQHLELVKAVKNDLFNS